MRWSSSGCGGNSHGRAYSVGGRTLITESSYPSGGREHGGGYGSSSSSSGGGYGYVATNHDLSIRSIYDSLGVGAYYGCQSDNSRKEKGEDGLSSPLKYVVNEIKLYNGYSPNAKAFVFSDCDLTAHDMNYLSATLPSNSYNLTLVDFSHNPQIGALGLDYLMKGAPGIVSLQSGNHDIHLMYQGILTRPNFNIVKLNLENCNIGDIGADIMSHALSSGKLPGTKVINVSGNQITKVGLDCFATALTREESAAELNLRYLDVSNEALARELKAHAGMDKMLQGIKNSKVHIAVVIAKITSGISSTSTLAVGSKEEKQAIIKDTLQIAQNNGVDVKNVAVSKGIYDATVNFAKLGRDFIIGFTKCNIVPDSVGSFAAEQITAKVSKKAFVVSATTDATLCFFDTAEEVATSPEGIQFIKDLDLVGANTLMDAIE